MSDKVSVLIVEDEAVVSLGLEDTLVTEDYQVAGIADNGREALDIMQNNVVDLLLLDIHIKGEWDGIETAKQLMAIKEVPFIFLTAFSDGETVERAKATSPAAYLIKPYQPQNLLITIDLALHNFAFRKAYPSKVVPLHPFGQQKPSNNKDTLLTFNDTVFIKQNYKFHKARLEHILYMETEGNYTHIITQETKYVLRNTMTDILEKLAGDGFVRIHRSYAINMQHLDSFTDISVFIGDRELPLGRHYKEAFMRRFNFL